MKIFLDAEIFQHWLLLGQNLQKLNLNPGTAVQLASVQGVALYYFAAK